jgi:hypothetical protein
MNVASALGIRRSTYGGGAGGSINVVPRFDRLDYEQQDRTDARRCSARRREASSSNDDGSFDYLAPGRDDRPATETGAWRFEPDGGGRMLADVAG